MNRIILSVLIIVGVFQLGGCATNAAVDKMSVTQLPVAQKPRNVSLLNNIAIKDVTGGHETNPLWMSQINNANFKEAIENSLRNTKLYGEPSNAKYSLDVALISLKQPYFGLDLKVVCQAHYKLQRENSNKILFDEDITTSYTATTSDAILAIERLRIANEGAAKANISEFIERLYQLPKV